MRLGGRYEKVKKTLLEFHFQHYAPNQFTKVILGTTNERDFPYLGELYSLKFNCGSTTFTLGGILRIDRLLLGIHIYILSFLTH